MTVSIDALSERLGPPMSVDPWGECLIIQGTEFNPDWESQLSKLGFKCHCGTLDNYAVTFVQLKRFIGTGYHKGPHWTPEEEKLLVEVINDTIYGKNRPVEIAIKQSKFADRTVSACIQRYEKIRRKILLNAIPSKPTLNNVNVGEAMLPLEAPK
jgi:hypothetical protein